MVCGRAGCDWSIEGPTGLVFACRDLHRLNAHGIVTTVRARRRGQPSILGRLSAGDHNRAMGERAPRVRDLVPADDELVDLDAEPDLEVTDEISADVGGP